MPSSFQFRSQRRNPQQGYILLTLMLFVALLGISAAALAPNIIFQMRRDREEELIHRGVQYSRAIRLYFKKFGRYPTRIEDLKNTNNLRFLRRPYKDPITGNDFKLLHYGEVQMFAGAGINGATAVSAMAGGNQNSSNFNPGGAGQPSSNEEGGPSTPGSGFNSNSSSSGSSRFGNSSGNGTSSSSSPSLFGGGSSAQTLSGGPIVGVISTSKAATIREFNGKNHYNQWQFIYDPAMDRGGLLNTPAQPPLQVSAPNLQQEPSKNGGFGTPASGFGTTGAPNSGSSPIPSMPPTQGPSPEQSQPQQ
jgi:type II secretory pathway pseudopilin PulG